jgi:hypothetical protein
MPRSHLTRDFDFPILQDSGQAVQGCIPKVNRIDECGVGGLVNVPINQRHWPSSYCGFPPNYSFQLTTSADAPQECVADGEHEILIFLYFEGKVLRDTGSVCPCQAQDGGAAPSMTTSGFLALASGWAHSARRVAATLQPRQTQYFFRRTAPGSAA